MAGAAEFLRQLHAVVGSDVVINTITGRVNRVDIASAGTEMVRAADGRAISARRYVYRGELENEVGTTRRADG